MPTVYWTETVLESKNVPVETETFFSIRSEGGELWLIGLQVMNVFARDISDIAAADTDVCQLAIGETRQLRIGALVLTVHRPVCTGLRHKSPQTRGDTKVGGGVLNKCQLAIP